MRQALRLHPASRCTAVTGIEAEVSRQQRTVLELHYAATGKAADLRLPPVAAPARGEGLWRHTCFEAFVRSATGPGYYEFNFAPSTLWAAYRFEGYRSGGRNAEAVAAPRIEVRTGVRRLELRTQLDLSGLPGLPGDAVWRLGLSAVVEEKGGNTSYWALAHPPGQPDFHHSDCFALELPAA